MRVCVLILRLGCVAWSSVKVVIATEMAHQPLISFQIHLGAICKPSPASGFLIKM